jgi:hypothetical protein
LTGGRLAAAKPVAMTREVSDSKSSVCPYDERSDFFPAYSSDTRAMDFTSITPAEELPQTTTTTTTVETKIVEKEIVVEQNGEVTRVEEVVRMEQMNEEEDEDESSSEDESTKPNLPKTITIIKSSKYDALDPKTSMLLSNPYTEEKDLVNKIYSAEVPSTTPTEDVAVVPVKEVHTVIVHQLDPIAEEKERKRKMIKRLVQKKLRKEADRAHRTKKSPKDIIAEKVMQARYERETKLYPVETVKRGDAKTTTTTIEKKVEKHTRKPHPSGEKFYV